MFGTIAAAASAAAPHVGQALVAGAKAAGGMAIAAKVTGFSNRQVGVLLNHLDDANEARKVASATQETTDIGFTPARERDAS